MPPDPLASPTRDAIGPSVDLPKGGRNVAFTLVLAAAMATTAFSIDTLLPAFDEIRTHYGLPEDTPDVAMLVTVFMLGLGAGQIPAGVLADRYGRRVVIWCGFVLYAIGAVLTLIAPTLGLMIAARFLWGVGAAGPRVAVTAIVRDVFQGEAMARQMSTIMAVFLIVPMVAPTIGAGLLELGSWRLVVSACLMAAAAVGLLSIRLPETLPVEKRRPITGSEVWSGWKMVFTAPGTIGCVMASAILTASFMSYISSSENIWDEVFGLRSWFPLIFAIVSACMALGHAVSGRVVGAIGLRHMMALLPGAHVILCAALVILALATGGEPPTALFLPLITLVLVVSQVSIVNANSAAMLPLGHVAGSAAAVVGSMPQICGAVLGTQIDAQFDGTITPMAIGFVATSVIALGCIVWSLRASRPSTHLTRQGPARTR